MKVTLFPAGTPYDARLRSIAVYAKVLLTYGTEEFNALALVPIPFSNVSRR